MKDRLSWDSCRAKGYLRGYLRGHLRGETKENSYGSNFQMRFSKKKNPKLLLIFLNPFGQTMARLEVDRKKKTWLMSHEEQNQTLPPVLEKWLAGSWWEDLSFIFGAPSQELKAQIFQDEKGRPVLYQNDTREVDCYYRGSIYPQYCKINEKTFSGRLNFSFVECREE